ncbi:hypothetical protein IBX65_05615 [Candidatus Aerophobetes bacterium]|nr:hypothetical protein [Candidatus Aerophobetes bacterium]
MKKVKTGEEEVEFLEEAEINSLFDELLQAAGRRGVPEKLINKTKKVVLKQTKKIEKEITKGKVKSEPIRKLREVTKRMQDIVKDPPSYNREVIMELLKKSV